MVFENIIYLLRDRWGVMSAAGHAYGRRLVLMVTYSDLFAFVIMLCAVITLVINITHQK